MLLCAIAFSGISLSGQAQNASAQTPAAPKAPAHRSCSLRAAVTDEDGGAIHGLFVWIRPKRAVAAGAQLTADKNGQLKIGLPPGLYDLFVTAPGFQPAAQVVDLRTCKAVDLNLMLLLDREP